MLPTPDQLAASDPAVSAFVSASAGSGKTTLLTDRLLRLMLAGADPGRIQCLTFTKAAAAEMANKLNRRLGEWVTMPDPELRAELEGLAIPDPASRLEAARALFARVLDLPGGMRIGTIHAFCQALLRRFPVEAALSPHFAVLDDTEADQAWRDASEAMLEEAHTASRRDALEHLAGLVTLGGFRELVRALQDEPELLDLPPEALAAAQRRVLGAEGSEEEILARAVAGQGADLLAALRRIAAEGAPQCAEAAGFMLEFLSTPVAERNWETWRIAFLTGEGKPRGPGKLVSKKLAESAPELLAAMLREQERVAGIEDARRAIGMAAASAALVALAAPVARRYGEVKEGTARLDYDDLIGRTIALLRDPGAAWVLYKLDGGLDHLLLDEVQDTSPAQWQIAGRLTEEFFAGEGAREETRSVFAVGDPKQSIYSFQGADPDAFRAWRGRLRARVGAAGQSWRDVGLNTSFRSTTPVLALVDAVFADPDSASGVVEPGERLRHQAARDRAAGAVEIWPLTPPPEEPPSAAWEVPTENLGRVGAARLLAEQIADWIARRCAARTLLPARGRPLVPGDVLVLVRRRDALPRALVRALKSRGVPVAGLDRMVLTEQPAVADLLALGDVLLLPEDDLQLATVLTSPLGGLSDGSLMDLALGRPGSLWAALQVRAGEREDWQAACDFLAVLMARVDFVTPHALFSEALGGLGGRARLLQRLGPEAAEPIDELLAAALTHQARHPSSLQGFLHWLRASGAEVKREAEGAQSEGGGGGAVRIMTVHGAKGLQAPLVILPDTTGLPPPERGIIWGRDPVGGGAVPLWAPRKELRCAAAEALRAGTERRRREEYNRLLYVALTRAEDELVICGWEPRGGVRDGCWYEQIARGFEKLESLRVAERLAWPGEVRRVISPQLVEVAPPAGTGAAAAPALPDWAGGAPDWRAAPPPREATPPQPLAPSRPEGAGLGPVPQAASPLSRGEGAGDRFRRGQIAHALLQHLPSLPPARRREAALAWLTRSGGAVEDPATLADQVLAVLDHPALAPLFGAHGRAEVPLTGVVGGMVVSGMVDRLAVLPDRVLIADYKTNRAAPDSAARVPVLYLRQMAAYREVLRGALPGRRVECALVWTATATVMPLDDALLDPHQPA